jgi:hypothetical protein
MFVCTYVYMYYVLCPTHSSFLMTELIYGGKGKGLPITGHEGPEGSKCIALLFLKPWR